MVFGFLVEADRGTIPVPADVLTNEPAAASTGLMFDPLPIWASVRVPVLLLYGENDRLEPARHSAALISEALARQGPAPQVVFFEHASHAITTRQTGLRFDWGESFHPDYYPTMVEWVVSGGAIGVKPASLSPSTSTGEFVFGEQDLLRSPWLQLGLFLALGITLPIAALLALWRLRKSDGRFLDWLDLTLAIGGSVPGRFCNPRLYKVIHDPFTANGKEPRLLQRPSAQHRRRWCSNRRHLSASRARRPKGRR